MNTFCPLPWNSINLRNNGNCRVCCNANSYTQNKGVLRNDDGTPHDVRTSKFDDVRNSSLLKEIRSKMIAGEWHEECQRCMNEESSGVTSRREYENSSYPEMVELAKKHTKGDGEIDLSNVPLQYVDIRYGNFCNLKCRMCGPTDSHMWIPDFYYTGRNSYNETDKVVNIYLKGDKPAIDYDYNWFSNNSNFEEEILKNIKNIKKLYIVGGEPLYIQEHYELLGRLVDSGNSSNIYLEYNTNMTSLPPKVIDLWKKFRGVMIGASIDGYGKVLEYQRNPANWETLYKNLKKVNSLIEESSPIRYEINDGKFQATAWLAFTVTNINVLHVPDFIKWKIEESGLDKFGVLSKPVISHHMCHAPRNLNIRSLHPMLKDMVEDKYMDFLEYSKGMYTDTIHKANEKIIRSIIKFMRGGDSSAGVEDWYSFLRYMKNLDEIRGENLFDVVPEYANFAR